MSESQQERLWRKIARCEARAYDERLSKLSPSAFMRGMNGPAAKRRFEMGDWQVDGTCRDIGPQEEHRTYAAPRGYVSDGKRLVPAEVHSALEIEQQQRAAMRAYALLPDGAIIDSGQRFYFSQVINPVTWNMQWIEI